MGTYIERRWEGDSGAYGGRKARTSFTYLAFVPDPIALLEPTVTFDTAARIEGAEAAVRALNLAPDALGLEAVGPLLLRSEAIASSRIEGFALSQRNLAQALIDPRAAKGTARSVAANVLAMEEAIAIGDSDRRLVADDLLAIHRTLMVGEPSRLRPGMFRKEQNWIGGRATTPIDARFIPPPHEHVEGLMDDLVRFANRDDLPAVAQAAIAHAQFEAIHPFLDGNGRVGRCLIHVVLRRRGVATRFVPPVSIVLAARLDAYLAGLTAYVEGRLEAWSADFADATERAARLSAELATQIARLQAEWYERAGRPRRDSAAARIIQALPAQPIVSTATIRAVTGASYRRALDALKSLEGSGVVRQISAGDYDRQYAADELFSLIERYEDRLGSRGTA